MLTIADITASYDNPHWLGFGYLNERRYALIDGDTGPAQPDRVAEADARLLAAANEQGWTAEELFDWLNSKPGRWYGEGWFGFHGDPENAERVARDYLHRVTD